MKSRIFATTCVILIVVCALGLIACNKEPEELKSNNRVLTAGNIYQNQAGSILVDVGNCMMKNDDDTYSAITLEASFDNGETWLMANPCETGDKDTKSLPYIIANPDSGSGSAFTTLTAYTYDSSVAKKLHAGDTITNLMIRVPATHDYKPSAAVKAKGSLTIRNCPEGLHDYTFFSAGFTSIDSVAVGDLDDSVNEHFGLYYDQESNTVKAGLLTATPQDPELGSGDQITISVLPDDQKYTDTITSYEYFLIKRSDNPDMSDATYWNMLDNINVSFTTLTRNGISFTNANKTFYDSEFTTGDDETHTDRFYNITVILRRKGTSETLPSYCNSITIGVGHEQIN